MPLTGTEPNILKTNDVPTERTKKGKYNNIARIKKCKHNDATPLIFKKERTKMILITYLYNDIKCQISLLLLTKRWCNQNNDMFC